jgi:C4-dicarboxylate transporter DctM subunit
MSGIIPGVTACLALCVLAYFIAKKRKYPRSSGFSLGQVGRSFKKAILALIMPIIILGGIYAGVFTPTESAVIAVVYGIVISMFVYREMTWKDLFKVFISSARSTANLMILVISAQLFGWLITMFNVPSTITAYVMKVAGSANVFLFFSVVLLIACGMFMEVGATVLILAPIMAPMASAFGVDPIHFGLLMVFVLAMGQATPPFGTTLFVASSITKEPVFAISKQLMPFIFCEILCAFLFAFVPFFSTLLPSLMK